MNCVVFIGAEMQQSIFLREFCIVYRKEPALGFTAKE
jgi:hypothetical protein